jgi:autophagy-related protein 9
MLSRLVPSGRGRSFYEELRSGDDQLDIEDRADVTLDERNLNQTFHDYDVEHAEGLAAGEGGRVTGESMMQDTRRGVPRPSRIRKDASSARWPAPYDDADNDVPASLLVEPNEAGHPSQQPSQRHRKNHPQASGPPGLPGQNVATRRPGPDWNNAESRRRLQPDSSGGSGGDGFIAGVVSGSAREEAMWRWVNVSNLDNFMRDVYDYYQGCGIWCILLERFLHLLNVAFVAVFLTFLTQCVDFKAIPNSKTMTEVLVPQCTRNMSGLWNFGLWIFAFYFIWKSIQNLLDLSRLLQVRAFYVHLLGIPEHDMQTIAWQDVVARIMMLRDANPRTAANLTPAQRRWVGSQSKERLDASDIANRLMRRENYLIALINKDILKLDVPVPFLQQREMLSRTLEWTLMFSILDFVFDEQGQVNQEFLKADRRGELSEKLRARFMFAGLMNLVLAPFLTGYLIIVYFLTYFKV